MSRSWREEVFEWVERGGERGAPVGVESVEALLEHRGARAAHGGEFGAPGVRERDPRRAGVERVRGPLHDGARGT